MYKDLRLSGITPLRFVTVLGVLIKIAFLPATVVAQDPSDIIKGRFYFLATAALKEQYSDNIRLENKNQEQAWRTQASSTGGLKYVSLFQTLEAGFSISSIRYSKSEFKSANSDIYYVNVSDRLRLFKTPLHLTLSNTYGVEERNSEQFLLRGGARRDDPLGLPSDIQGDGSNDTLTPITQGELLGNPEAVSGLVQNDTYSVALDFEEMLSRSLRFNSSAKYYATRSFSEDRPNSRGYQADFNIESTIKSNLTFTLGYGYWQQRYEFLIGDDDTSKFNHFITTTILYDINRRSNLQVYISHSIFDYKNLTAASVNYVYFLSPFTTIEIKGERDRSLYTTLDVQGGFINSTSIDGIVNYSPTRNFESEISLGYTRDTGIVFVGDNRRVYSGISVSFGFTENLFNSTYFNFSWASRKPPNAWDTLLVAGTNFSYRINRYFSFRLEYKNEQRYATNSEFDEYRLNVVSFSMVSSFDHPRGQ